MILFVGAGSFDMCGVGILTFHCSDNYGAMLQAYGLKEGLRKKGIKAEIIRYEPPFMTGRHWWIPYIPSGGISGMLIQGGYRWRANLRLGKAFFEKRSRMRQFRKKYLTGEEKRKIYFCSQLKKLDYADYIVGSDQIWNPDITCGLRRAYFGDFKNKNKKRVVAYAASLGKEALPEKYDKTFSELLQHVDTISVREKSAASYVKRLCGRAVAVVPDPVFLLEKKEWQKIEKMLWKNHFIFVYMTENNETLVEFTKELAERKNLSIITDKNGTGLEGENVLKDHTAGPAEFLGYIHRADYVVTNSFHGTAFSIIYQKKFMVFPHSGAGGRISDIIKLSGLGSRLYRENGCADIDAEINWNKVKRRIRKNVEAAERFLAESIRR